MAKRKLEIDTLDDITEPIPTASLHGVIQTLSQIKKGKQTNYYEGKLSIIEHSSQRFVGFKKSQQAKLKELMDNQQPVYLEDCEIKKAKRGNSMEILLKSSTTIHKSPKKFDTTVFNLGKFNIGLS